ncbi:hypothetical protein FRB94_010541 [Tulasnella sp. JGI-2019a]|nr:hypothetical protein FRB94_010541 [Tulasnella sp. JGI-2019a]
MTAFASSSKAAQYHQYSTPANHFSAKPTAEPPTVVPTPKIPSRSITKVDLPSKSPPAIRHDHLRHRDRPQPYVFIDNLEIIKADPKWARIRRSYFARKKPTTTQRLNGTSSWNAGGQKTRKGKENATIPIYIEISSDDDEEEAHVNQVLDLDSALGGSSAPVSISRSASSTLVPCPRKEDKGKKRMRSYSPESDLEELHKGLQGPKESSKKRETTPDPNRLPRSSRRGRRKNVDDNYYPSDIDERPRPESRPKIPKTTSEIVPHPRSRMQSMTTSRPPRSGSISSLSTAEEIIEDSEIGRQWSGQSESEGDGYTDRRLGSGDPPEVQPAPPRRKYNRRISSDLGSERMTSPEVTATRPVKIRVVKRTPNTHRESTAPHSDAAEDDIRDDTVDSSPPKRCKVIVKRPRKAAREQHVDLDGNSDCSQNHDTQKGQRAPTVTSVIHQPPTVKQGYRATDGAAHNLHQPKRPLMVISDQDLKQAERQGTVVKKHCHMCRTPRWTVLCTGMIQRTNKVEKCTKGVCDRCLSKYPLPFDPFDSQFVCPSCTGTCICASCMQRRSSKVNLATEQPRLPRSKKIAQTGSEVVQHKQRPRVTSDVGVNSSINKRKSSQPLQASRLGSSSEISSTNHSLNDDCFDSPFGDPLDVPPPTEDPVTINKERCPSVVSNGTPLVSSPWSIDAEIACLNSANAAVASAYGLPEELSLPSTPNFNTATLETKTRDFSPHLWKLSQSPSPVFRVHTPTNQSLSHTEQQEPAMTSIGLTPVSSPQQPTHRPSDWSMASLVQSDVERSWSVRRESLLWASLERHTQLARKNEKYGYGFLTLDPDVVMQGYTWTGGTGMFAFDNYTDVSDPWPWPREGPGELKDEKILSTSRAMSASLAPTGEQVINWDDLDLKKQQTKEVQGLGLGQIVQSPHQSACITDTAVVVSPPTTDPNPDDRIEGPPSPTEVDDITPSTSVATVTAPLPEDPYVDEAAAKNFYEKVVIDASDVGFTPPPTSRRDKIFAALASLRATGRIVPGLIN